MRHTRITLAARRRPRSLQRAVGTKSMLLALTPLLLNLALTLLVPSGVGAYDDPSDPNTTDSTTTDDAPDAPPDDTPDNHYDGPPNYDQGLDNPNFEPNFQSSSSSDNPGTKSDIYEFIAFAAWYVFLVLCCVIPTYCAYRRRARAARAELEAVQNMQTGGAAGSGGLGWMDEARAELERRRAEDADNLAAREGEGMVLLRGTTPDGRPIAIVTGMGSVGGAAGLGSSATGGIAGGLAWPGQFRAGNSTTFGIGGRPGIGPSMSMGGSIFSTLAASNERERVRRDERRRVLERALRDTTMVVRVEDLVRRRDSSHSAIGGAGSVRNGDDGFENDELAAAEVGVKNNDEDAFSKDDDIGKAEAVSSTDQEDQDKGGGDSSPSASSSAAAATSSPAADLAQDPTAGAVATAASYGTYYDALSEDLSFDDDNCNDGGGGGGGSSGSSINGGEEPEFALLRLRPPTTSSSTTSTSGGKGDVEEGTAAVAAAPPASATSTGEGTRTVPNSCAICLSAYVPTDSVTWCTTDPTASNFPANSSSLAGGGAFCRHAFHTECILTWLSKKEEPLCPCCRQDFVGGDVLGRVGLEGLLGVVMSSGDGTGGGGDRGPTS